MSRGRDMFSSFWILLISFFCRSQCGLYTAGNVFLRDRTNYCSLKEHNTKYLEAIKKDNWATNCNHPLSWVFVRTPCKVKGPLGSKMPTFQRKLHCTAAHPYHWRKKARVTVRTKRLYFDYILRQNICHSRQYSVLGLAHKDVGQLFSPVGCWQSESLEGCQCILQTVPHSHSLLVAWGGHTSHLLKPWERKQFMRGGKTKTNKVEQLMGLFMTLQVVLHPDLCLWKSN